MKNLIKCMMVLGVLSLTGCTKIIYTHDEVLSHYLVKQDVMRRFGLPTEQKTADTTEAWLYSYDKTASSIKHSVTESLNASTVDVVEFNSHKKYLVFIFDKKGNVIRINCQGVDLTVKKHDTVATIALITAGAGLIISGGVYISHHLFDGFTYSY